VTAKRLNWNFTKLRTKLLFMVVLMSAGLLIVSQCAEAARLKASPRGDDIGGGCSNTSAFNQGAVVLISPTDATRALSGDTLTKIRGDQGFTEGDGINSSSMYLDCGGQAVAMEHPAVSFQLDSETGVVSMPLVTISSYNQADINAIVPPIDQQAIWCDLYLPEKDSGCTWEFPNAILLDRVAPDVTYPNLKTFPIIPLSTGQAYLTWTFSDTNTPGDPDGENGSLCPSCTAACYACNKTDTRAQWQFFRRNMSTPLYDTTPDGSTNGSDFYITDTAQTTTKNRLIESADAFCYILRIQDTAGNWSIETDNINQAGTPTKEMEKCVQTDGAPPAIQKIEYFTSYDPLTGFSRPFPKNQAGEQVLTSNPCFFDPDTPPPNDCYYDPITETIDTPRYIEMRITTSEPFFDGVNHYGYTLIMGDDFDNDNDDSTDEETGGFDHTDNDPGIGDGLIDEDVAYTTTTYNPPAVGDQIDNDADGYVDEHSDSAPGKDSTSRHCSAGQLFNRALSIDETVCLDLPTITISGLDSEGRVNGDSIEWICTQDTFLSVPMNTHPECQGLDPGQSVYRYRWKVGDVYPGADVPPVGIEEDYYKVYISGADGVGNTITNAQPPEGKGDEVFFDNSPPQIEMNYYRSSNFTNKFTVVDHDNDASTPNMPIVPEGTVYLSLTSKYDTTIEYLGATPEVYIFLPNSASPSYEGEPQYNQYATTTLYMACAGQNANCNYCTGANCIAYDPDTNPCETFRGCFEVASSTVENGYAAITVKARDRFYNRKWHETDGQALADQIDQDKERDDAGIDGEPDTGDPAEDDTRPNYVSLSPDVIEPDIDIKSGQFFAIDTTPPATPAISLPVSPCNNQIARDNGSCLPTVEPVNRPTIRWTALGNGLDDDYDGITDEECVDGQDGSAGDTPDPDTTADDDGKVCSDTDTAAWEVSQWQLQVSTSPGFEAGTMIRDTIVTGATYYTIPYMDERPLDTPYYWRVAPYDKAGNKGPYNPKPPLVATDQPYFTFGVDTEPPVFSVRYYLTIDTDKDCSDGYEMKRNQDGTPVTGDTASDPNKLVCLKLFSNEPVATDVVNIPMITTYQSGSPVESTSTVAVPSGTSTAFITLFEVDAKGTGLEYDDGEVELKITAVDVYGNDLNEGAPATGAIFIVDSTNPECLFESPYPDPSSMNNDGDEFEAELDDDATTIMFTCNKFIGDTVNIRVLNEEMGMIENDMLDNDVDGRIDEESTTGSDDDGDGETGEDVGAYGQIDGSGALIEAEYEDGSGYTYRATYTVLSEYYHGQADVYLGDTSTSSPYYMTDLAGTPIYAHTTFDIDTNAPAAPTLKSPIQGQVLDTSLPQFKWAMTPRVSDLSRYRVEIATTSSFTHIAAYADVSDQSGVTNFSYPLQKVDVMQCYDTEIYHPDRDICPLDCYDTDPLPPSCYEPAPDPDPELCPSSCYNTYDCPAECYNTDPVSCPAECYETDPFTNECYDTNPLSYCPGLSDNIYYWRVYAFDQANNRSDTGLRLSFKVDSEPPGPPGFNSVTTPTSKTTSPLSGFTDPPEPNARVSIFVNDQYIGMVYTDSSGNFTVGIDDDKDGLTDEDPVNGSDDDFDDQTDEDPPGIFLTEGINKVEGLVIDEGGNEGTKGCDTDTPFYDDVLGSCIIQLDSGPPKFNVNYYSSPEVIVVNSKPTLRPDRLLPVIDATTGKQAATATTVYMMIKSSEPLVDDEGTIIPPTFTVDQQGTTDVSQKTASPIVATSTQTFVGSFETHQHNPPNFVDGDAKIVVIGTDAEGNSTPPGTLPTIGAYLTIDTQTPTFTITYWMDQELRERASKDIDNNPITKAGDFWLRIVSNEWLPIAPTVNVNQVGTQDDSSQATSIDTDGLIFKYGYTAHTTDGSNYRDGIAYVTLDAVDIAGNSASGIVPVQGKKFNIDTVAPQPPTIVLPATYTTYTQINNVAGTVVDVQNNAEPYADIEIFVSMYHESMADQIVQDDGIDNDGDGKTDEEPVDGVDNDNDLFVDEDTTSNSCSPSNYFWDSIYSECIYSLDEPTPDGTATANSTGGYTTSVTGIQAGLNYLYGRATDMAGNTSELSSGTTLSGLLQEALQLSHTFSSGWNLIGVPLQPAHPTPAMGLGLGNMTLFQLKNGKYIYKTGLDPIAPGMCYWGYFTSETKTTVTGVNSVTNKIKLEEGWNLVSVPYNQGVIWNSNMGVSYSSSSTVYDIGSEDANEFVAPYIYFYDGDSDPPEYSEPIGIEDETTIQPWVGFAIKAYQDCWLVFPSIY